MNEFPVCAFSPHRYRHDSSETEEDNIKCIATDGVNSVDFVLHIKVKKKLKNYSLCSLTLTISK